jgi:class 3 adenylate cyclase
VRSQNLAIVFAGLSGYAEHLGAQTWEESQRMLRLHEALVAPVLRRFKGRRIKQIAGTFLIAFESPTQAVLCAAALQDRAGRLQLDVRVGIHLGEVRLARGDVFGEAVNIAARIQALCGPGEVLFGESAWLSMNRAEVRAEDAGARRLKGVPEPVRIHRLQGVLKPQPDLGPLPSAERPEVHGEFRRHLYDAAQVAMRRAEEALPRLPSQARVFVGAGLAAMLAVAAFFALARLAALP